MRKQFGTVEILTGTGLPGKNGRGPASFKGQLYLEIISGDFYRATDKGPDVEWKLWRPATTSQINTSKGEPNGLGSLDAFGKQPESQVPERLTSVQLSKTFGLLPESYIDARMHPNGNITEITHGIFSASFGNSPASIADGVIVHTPSGPSNTAAYLQTRLTGPTRRMGAIVEFPTGTNGGAVALVIPSGSWSSGITNSGVHVTITGGTGAVNSARFVGGGLQGTNLWLQGYPITGLHTIEVSVNTRRQEITVFLDGIRVLKYTDSIAFDYLSNYAIWELFEFTGTSLTPAKIISAWADTERFVPSQLPQSDIQPQIGRNFGATFLPGTLTNYPLSTTAGSPAGFGTLTGVSVPPSGKFAVEFSCWVDASAGTVRLYAGIDSQAAIAIAPAGYVGRIVFHGIITGYTPGTTVTLTPKLWLGGGTGNVIVGGAYGYASISAYGLAS